MTVNYTDESNYEDHIQRINIIKFYLKKTKNN